MYVLPGIVIACVVLHGYAAEQGNNEVNQRTPLHYAAMVGKGNYNFRELDMAKSILAAALMLENNTIHDKDAYNKTPFDYVQENREQLPLTFKIMQQGEKKHRLECKWKDKSPLYEEWYEYSSDMIAIEEIRKLLESCKQKK